MNAEQFERAIKFAVKRIVEALEAWQEPWAEDRSRLPEYLEMRLFKEAFGEWPELASTLRLDTQIRRGHDESEDEFARRLLLNSRGSELARTVLTTLGIEAAEDSRLLADLGVQMAKLQLGIRRVMQARSNGDHSAADNFISYYQRAGLAPSKQSAAAAMTPTISEAWATYSAEKLSGPRPAWGDHTAKKQQAAFEEWRDIISNVHVGEITRETMLDVRSKLGKLPANAHKRYPGKTIAELLAMDIPEDQLPADRTVHDKFVQLGSFLRWCRVVKHYLTTDPMIGVYFDPESQSYAPFNLDDLKRMFNGKRYEQGKHRKSWQFWQPLLALYTGARQTELAQLQVSDVVREEGVWVLSINDAGDDQSVKTSAGVRKVPISSKLQELGFLDYVELVRRRGEQRLFPDLEKGTHGWGEKVSRWFADTFAPSAGIQPDPSGRRKVWHSFRHTAITKALSKGQPLAHTQQVFGHEKSLLGESATYMGAYARLWTDERTVLPWTDAELQALSWLDSRYDVPDLSVILSRTPSSIEERQQQRQQLTGSAIAPAPVTFAQSIRRALAATLVGRERGSHKWTPEEDAALRWLAERYSILDLQLILRRPTHSIEKRLLELAVDHPGLPRS